MKKLAKLINKTENIIRDIENIKKFKELENSLNVILEEISISKGQNLMIKIFDPNKNVESMIVESSKMEKELKLKQKFELLVLKRNACFYHLEQALLLKHEITSELIMHTARDEAKRIGDDTIKFMSELINHIEVQMK